MKKLSVIIVNYNTKDILEKCLRNLSGKYPNIEMIVVDNGSSDGSSDMVKEQFSDVVVIDTQNNGLAAGSNLGFKRATGDFILYLGSDAFPNGSTLTGIVDYLEGHIDVGIATCKLVLRDGNLDMDAHRGFPTPWASFTHFSGLEKLLPNLPLFNGYFLGYRDFEAPHEIDMCIAHFMLIRRKVFDDIGLWDEDFFVYGEDVDFCYRAKHAGWKVMYLPQWSAVHYKGVSVGIRKESKDISHVSREHKLKMLKSTTRAMQLFYKKHYAKKYPWIITRFVLWGISVLGFLRTLFY